MTPKTNHPAMRLKTRARARTENQGHKNKHLHKRPKTNMHTLLWGTRRASARAINEDWLWARGVCARVRSPNAASGQISDPAEWSLEGYNKGSPPLSRNAYIQHGVGLICSFCFALSGERQLRDQCKHHSPLTLQRFRGLCSVLGRGRVQLQKLHETLMADNRGQQTVQQQETPSPSQGPRQPRHCTRSPS